jgi:hypothetical protein
VAANVTMFGPAKVSTNSVWGKDDAVEISIAGKTSDGQAATFVVRGFAGGALQSATDAGAPAAAAARLARETRFAVKSSGGPAARSSAAAGAASGPSPSRRWASSLRPG